MKPLTAEQAAPKRRGRPPAPADQRRDQRAELRMTAAEREKYLALGGLEWFHAQLRKAKLPT